MVHSTQESDLQIVATLLQDEGYRARIEPERDAILSAAGGLKIAIYLRKGNLQVRCIMGGEDYNIQLRHVNNFNAGYRFAKMYLDDDGDIFLECDFLFDVHKDDAAATLSAVMSISEGSIGAMLDVIRAADNEAEHRPAVSESEPPIGALSSSPTKE